MPRGPILHLNLQVQVETSIRKVISQYDHGKNFLASGRTKFLNTKVQNIPAYAHEKTNYEYLSAYNAKFFHRHEPTLAEDHACCASAGGLISTDLQPTHAALDYDSHHVLAPRPTRAMPGGLGN